MAQNIKDFELEKAARRLEASGLREGEDFHKIIVPEFGHEAWRLVEMMEHPTEAVFVDGHGFYESMASHIRTSLARAYECGAHMYVSLQEKNKKLGKH